MQPRRDRIRALVVPALEPAHITYLSTNEDVQAATLQALVAGYVEGFHPCGSPCHRVTGWHGFANEDGLNRGLIPNHRATRLAVKAGWHEWSALQLVGTVVFTGCEPGTSQSTDVPADLLHIAQRIGLHPLMDPR